jgi:membrane protein implicated in regulation of membrane protease activity
MSRDAIEATVIAATNKATATGSVTALLGWITTNEALGLLGLSVGFLGLVVNWYYRREQNRRDERRHAMEEKEHQRRMEKMRTSPTPLEGDHL